MNLRTATIARALVEAASTHSRTTYPILAGKVGWYNPTGQGLGTPLTEILKYCKDHGLPALTAIVCNTGTSAPSADGIRIMHQVFGAFDLKSEQDRVFKFDWSRVEEFGSPKQKDQGIDFSKLYATRGYGFDPDRWGMLGFGKDGNRQRVLELMAGEPVYVVQFCSPNQQLAGDGTGAMRPENIGRVLGIMEVAPVEASPETHIEAAFRAESVAHWGKDKWPYGLEITRAWIFPERPFSKDVLPQTSSASWEATNSIVKLTFEEAAALVQHEFVEVPVFGSSATVFKAFEQKEALYTYMAVCLDSNRLIATNAPKGSLLTKIGITNNPYRRLLEISGNHLAVIFGLKFSLIAQRRWKNQAEAFGVESLAHQWADKHTVHASGEYYFMSDAQIASAEKIVLIGRE